MEEENVSRYKRALFNELDHQKPDDVSPIKKESDTEFSAEIRSMENLKKYFVKDSDFKDVVSKDLGSS